MGSAFSVTVETDEPVPPGEEVSVMVTFDGSTQTGTLSASTAVATVMFTAPGTTTGTFTVEATGEPSMTNPNALRLTVTPASISVEVVPQSVQLMLTTLAVVNENVEFPVTVSVFPALLAGITLTVEVTFGEASSEQVTLSATRSSQELRFTASALGPQEVRAQAVDVEPEGLVIAASATETVEVLAEGIVALTLDAPDRVTVGDVFTVAVGVAEGTPLPVGTTVTATVSFAAGTADSTEREVVLTPAMSSDTVRFTAPVTAGDFTVAVSGSTDDVSIDEVLPASIQVSVDAVVVMLTLSGPDTVTVGQTYQVTVDTNRPVPQGSTLEVTVSVSTELQEPQVVFLAGDSSGVATFTAPMRTDQVSVTAMATPDTAADALEVAASAADTLTVAVSALDVQLVLSELPSAPVAVGSTFPVTVATVPALPAGAAVTVTLILADLPGVEVELRPGASTQSVAVTAPDEAGPAPLLAEGVEAASSMLELDVLAVTATVQVAELAIRNLVLRVPDQVEAGSTFSVTVSTNEPLPEAATVLVMVTFAGSTQTGTLSAGETTATVMFTAPGTTTGTFTVDATGAPIVTDGAALQLTVDPTSASVEVVPVAIMLQLTAPVVVNGNSTFAATVNTDRVLPAGTVVNLTVQFGEATGTVTLSGTTPTASVEFTAPPRGLLELSASVTEITQSSPVVEVSAPTPVNVQVTELVTLRLILEAPERVEVGSAFSVTVETDEPVPPGEEVSVMVTFDGSTQTGTLSASTAVATVMFTAPGTTTGTFTVEATGEPSMTNPNALRLTVTPASISVEVVPQSVQLMLTTLAVVNENVAFPVTVSVFPALLAGITLTVEVTFGEASSEQVTLSATRSSQELRFTASALGPQEVRAQAVDVEPEGLVIAASATETVEVLAEGVVALTLDAPANVTVGDVFTVAVGVAEGTPLPVGTTVTATVSFAAGTADSTEREVVLTPAMSSDTVRFTAPVTAGDFTVAVSGSTDDVSIDEVLPASIQVSVDAVVVMLTLSGPDAVTVGGTYRVTVGATVGVGAEPEVPAGTTVTVTVSLAGQDSEPVALTPQAPTTSVAVTAPNEAGPALLRAEGAAAVGSVLELNVLAATATVQVLAPVELTLDVPENVTVGATFTVTVGVAEGTLLPEGVSVTANLSFRAETGEEIDTAQTLLTPASSEMVTFTAPDTAGRYTVAVSGISSDGILLVIGTTVQVSVAPVLVLDVPSAPIYRGVMFPVRVRLLGGLLEDNGSVGVTVYLRNAVTGVAASTRAATLSAADSSMVLTFEAVAGEAAVTAYSLSTEDIDLAGLDPTTSINLQGAATATVFVTRINADLSGNGVFDADDALLIARGLLTENYLARSAGGLTELDPDTFQARLSELADFADISGDDKLDIIDAVFLVRNAGATVSDLQRRADANDNPFAYLCGSSASDACENIPGDHLNISPGGIRYEAIGEVLDNLRRVPQPPTLLPPNSL